MPREQAARALDRYGLARRGRADLRVALRRAAGAAADPAARAVRGDAAAARRADRQPRPALGRGAGGRPGRVRGHGARRDPRPLVRPRLRPVPGVRRRRPGRRVATSRSGTRAGSGGAAPADPAPHRASPWVASGKGFRKFSVRIHMQATHRRSRGTTTSGRRITEEQGAPTTRLHAVLLGCALAMARGGVGASPAAAPPRRSPSWVTCRLSSAASRLVARVRRLRAGRVAPPPIAGTFAMPRVTWAVKVALNDSWAVNYGAGGALDGGNIPLLLARPGGPSATTTRHLLTSPRSSPGHHGGRRGITGTRCAPP